MSVMSEPSVRQTLPGSPNATSSLELAGGLLPYDSPAGQMIALFGLAPALASLSALQAQALGLMTSGTCGRTGTTSSSSAALASSLANRLQARMASRGSILFTLTWKQRTTPSGRLICALRASGRRTSDNDCGSWPTPAARDYRHANALPRSERGGGKKGEQLNNAVVHLMRGWATPRAEDANVPTTGGERTGPIPNGCTARTASLGQLNPAHSRWLMGYPPEWDAYGVTAMQSSPKSPRRSSLPTSTP